MGFIGRERELVELVTLLGQNRSVTLAEPAGGNTQQASPARLVTLTGAGGVGKTRLTLAASRRARGQRCLRGFGNRPAGSIYCRLGSTVRYPRHSLEVAFLVF